MDIECDLWPEIIYGGAKGYKGLEVTVTKDPEDNKKIDQASCIYCDSVIRSWTIRQINLYCLLTASQFSLSSSCTGETEYSGALQDPQPHPRGLHRAAGGCVADQYARLRAGRGVRDK